MGEVTSAATAKENGEVLCNGFSVGSSCKFCSAGAVGNEALVGGHPGVELAEGLLEVSFKIVKEKIAVLTEDEVFELVERSDGSLGLVFISLGFRFTSTSMTVGVACKPEIVDANPHGAEKGRKPLTLLVSHGTVVSDAVLGLKVAPFFGEFAAE